MSGRARARGKVHGQETTVSNFGVVTEMTDKVDDSCTSSFQLLRSIKKKKKRKNKLRKLNREMNKQSVNPTLRSSFFSEPSSVFDLHVDSQDTEDIQTQQEKSRSKGKDNAGDSCAGSFELLGSIKKKKKRKNKLGKLNKEMDKQSVNPTLCSPFFSEPSSVFALHVDHQDAEDNQTQQQKSKGCKKGTMETPDTQLENHWVVKESNLDHAVGTVALKKKRKRKHWSIKQDGINECFITETPEEASSLPEADPLEEVGGSCEITTMKKEKEEQVITKKASVGRPDFANDLKETREYIFVSSSQASPKTQDVDLLQNKVGGKLSIPDPSAGLSSSTAQPSVSSPTGNSDATKDSLLVKNTVEAVGNHDNSQQYHIYSKEEKKKLKKYQARFGNDWKKMSELRNRSSRSLHLKYDKMKSKFNSGAWSKEETKKLLHTLKEILWAKVEGLDSTLEPKNMDQAMLLRKNLYKGIPWFQVQAKVGTRRWKQCKKKWLYFVTKKMSQGKMRNHGLENLKFKIDLIERNAPPDYVRNRFYKIKSLYAPYWNKKTFPETIDYLHKEILPKLRSKMARGETKELATADRSWKRLFKFNEIFQDDDDLIDEEEEEEDSLRGGASE